MAYSYITYTADGSTTDFNINFNYLNENHIIVTVDDVTQTKGTHYTFDTATDKIQFVTAPTSSAVVKIRRSTPVTEAGQLVSFVNGSALRATDLNNMKLQLLYALQEALDTQVALSSYSVIDDDTLATASATSVPTSECVKAYVDAQASLSTLGSNLDVATYDIVSSSNRDIDILPHGTGVVNIGNKLNVDNIQLDGNSVNSTNTDGDINLTPNGSGKVVVQSPMDVDSAIRINNNTISTLATNANLNLAPDGTGKINTSKELAAGNISINKTANSIESTDTDGDINIVPNGNGQIKLKYGLLPASTGTTGQGLRLDSSGDFEWFTPTTGGIGSVVEDTAPVLGGDLDTNAKDILIDTTHGINDENDNEQVVFTTTASAVNHVGITNAATGNDPAIAAIGDDTNIDLKLSGKGTGSVTINNAYTLPASDGTNGQVLTTDGAGAVSWEAGGGGGASVGSFKNKIINGAMDIWQRGTSFTTVASGTYTADRWLYEKSGSMVHTVERSTDVPSAATANHQFNYSLKADCTTADASIAAGDYAAIVQRVEGYNIKGLSGQSFTLSFWVKSAKTGTHCVGLINNGSDRSYVAEYTVSVADTWEKKSVTISDFSSAGGTWAYTNATGLFVYFPLACGSTYQTTAGSWQTGLFLATSSQVNVCDNSANDFFITGVQIEPGTTATDLEARSIQEELVLCQRYYEQSAGDIGSSAFFSGDVTSGATYLTTRVFTVDKRTTPTVTNTSSFLLGFTSIASISDIDTKGFRIAAQATSTVSAGYIVMYWTANAEL